MVHSFRLGGFGYTQENIGKTGVDRIDCSQNDLKQRNSCDIIDQIKAWAEMVSSSSPSPLLVKGISTHATIDINDGRQETSTGKGTTHDTNCTIFQPLLPGMVLLQFFLKRSII